MEYHVILSNKEYRINPILINIFVLLLEAKISLIFLILRIEKKYCGKQKDINIRHLKKFTFLPTILSLIAKYKNTDISLEYQFNLIYCLLVIFLLLILKRTHQL